MQKNIKPEKKNKYVKNTCHAKTSFIKVMRQKKNKKSSMQKHVMKKIKIPFLILNINSPRPAVTLAKPGFHLCIFEPNCYHRNGGETRRLTPMTG